MFNFASNTQLSQDQAYQQLKNDSSITLLDVRTEEEYTEDGHIAGSVNVPLHLLPVNVAKALPDKNAQIFVICYSGARASDAVNYLKRLGYTKVFNIGGVATWRYGLTR